MADELQGSAPEGIDPLATSLALSGASRAKADAFLDDQRHHMKEQLREIGLRLWELRLGVLLRMATAFIGLAVAGFLAFLVWDASRSDGLSIESFSVPPDLAATGLSGEVMAARLLDRINVMQAATSSSRAPRSVSGNWDTRDVRLAIPETGVSLAELENFLRAKLGKVSRLSGEMVRTPAGITLTARVSGSGAVSVNGKEADIETLTQQLAEQVYRLTQPFLYGSYLNTNRRYEEAIPVFEQMIRSTDPLERAFGYHGKASTLSSKLGVQAAVADYERALAIEPDLASTRSGLGGVERYLGHEEAWLQNSKIALALLADRNHGNARADFVPAYRGITQGEIHAALGAYRDAVLARQDFIGINIPGRTYGIDQVIDVAAEHDMAAARQAMAAYASNPTNNPAFVLYGRAFLALRAQDWRGVLAQMPAIEQMTRENPNLRVPLRTFFAPLAAMAAARLGDFGTAETQAATMPGDCTRCMVAHGIVAELQGQHARADWWFAQGAAAAPSIPFANFEWGKALLARGKLDDAVRQFRESNKRGPHFADALEGWGEALIAKNQSHLALAKFAEAEKYAPNWGRLHLKWGEALYYVGKPADAKVHFARAAALDLTPDEKSGLARHQ